MPTTEADYTTNPVTVTVAQFKNASWTADFPADFQAGIYMLDGTTPILMQDASSTGKEVRLAEDDYLVKEASGKFSIISAATLAADYTIV
jgi:hypothetical protein